SRNCIRRGLTLDARTAYDTIETNIGELREIGPHERLRHAPATRSLLAPYFEDVGIVGGEFQRQRDVEWREGEVTDMNPLVTGSLPEGLGAVDVEAAARQDPPAAEVEVGVGEIHAEQEVVTTYGRGKQQRARAP